MNKAQVVHVAAEAAVIGGLTAYLINENAKLKKDIAELRRDLQVIARYQLRVQQNHATAISGMIKATRISETAKAAVPPSEPNPPVQKKVRFAEQPKPRAEVSDDELLASEFGGDEEAPQDDEPSVEEEVSSEEEEAAPIRQPSNRRDRLKNKGKKMQPSKDRKQTTGMDDIKQRAAALKAAAEQED